ncbi:hypothetical protein C0J52_23278 [Blattella germanica]|nr:hypothetical protein C0J52_23278 [Blattella germanica]
MKDGKEGVVDESRSGRPSTNKTSENIERVLQFIVTDSPDLASADFVFVSPPKISPERLMFS